MSAQKLLILLFELGKSDNMIAENFSLFKSSFINSAIKEDDLSYDTKRTWSLRQIYYIGYVYITFEFFYLKFLCNTNDLNVYCRELAPRTVCLTGDRAQGDDSKQCAYSRSDMHCFIHIIINNRLRHVEIHVVVSSDLVTLLPLF